MSEAEIFDMLVKYSIGGSLDNQNIKTFFRAKFDRDNHSFTLLQVFDYGPNNQIRPEIKGHVKTLKDVTRIDLNIELPNSLALILDFAIILNIGAWIAFLYIPLPELFPSDFMVYAMPIALVLMLLFGKGFFNSKYADCETLIRRMVQAK